MIYALLLVNGELRQRRSSHFYRTESQSARCRLYYGYRQYLLFAFGGMKGVAWVTVLHSALKYFGILAIMGFALSKPAVSRR